MYKPIFIMLHTGSTVYVHRSKYKVFVVTYMNFNVCLSCSIHDSYLFLFFFCSHVVCYTPWPVYLHNTTRDMATVHSNQKEEELSTWCRG